MNDDPAAQVKFRAISEAYSILGHDRERCVVITIPRRSVQIPTSSSGGHTIVRSSRPPFLNPATTIQPSTRHEGGEDQRLPTHGNPVGALRRLQPAHNHPHLLTPELNLTRTHTTITDRNQVRSSTPARNTRGEAGQRTRTQSKIASWECRAFGELCRFLG